METVSNSIEDKLIDGLSFKLDATASYITDRKSSTYWAVGSNIRTQRRDQSNQNGTKRRRMVRPIHSQISIRRP